MSDPTHNKPKNEEGPNAVSGGSVASEADRADWLERLDRHMSVDTWGQLHWKMMLRRQIDAAKEGQAKGFWSNGQFADWLTGWAAEDRAAQYWPLGDLDWLIQQGARIEEGPADALMIGGARSGRLEWLAKGWARELASEESTLAPVVQPPPAATETLGAERKNAGSMASRAEARRQEERRIAARGGWRWSRDPEKRPHEKRRAEHGHMRSPHAEGVLEEYILARREAGGAGLLPGGARFSALRAAWAAARAGQRKALEWIAREALPPQENAAAWRTVLDVAQDAMRPQALEWVAGALDEAESQAAAQALPEEFAAEQHPPAPSRAASRRAMAFAWLIKRGSHRQCSIFMNLALSSAPKEWSEEEKRAWLAGGEDCLLATLKRPIDREPEGAAIAARLVQKGWRWEESGAMETAMLQTRYRAGLGIWRGINWPHEDAGIKALKTFNIPIAGQEARLACCVMASSSPAGIAKWAFEPHLELAFDRPAENGAFAGKTALGVARERLDTLRLDPFRPGEIEALHEAIAKMERMAIRSEIDTVAGRDEAARKKPAPRL